MELISSPFVYLFEAYVIYSFAYENFNPITRKRSILISVFLSYALLCLVFNIFNSAIINILAITVVDFLILKFLFDATPLMGVIGSVFLSTAMTCSEFLAMTILSIGTDDISGYKDNYANYVIMLLICKILYLLIAKVYTAFHDTFSKKSRYPLFLFIFPVSAVVILYVLWYTAFTADISHTAYLVITIGASAVTLSVVLTYIFYAKTERDVNELHRKLAEQKRIENEVTYYEILDRQNEEMREYVHNEKNHLMTIMDMSSDDSIKNYISEIYDELEVHSMFGKTQNKYLDVIINKYRILSEHKNISFSVSVRTSNLSFISDPDLVTLLSNIFDNAVEAAEISERKEISFELKTVNGFEMLTCSNSCCKSPEFVGDTLKTTKKDKQVHGYGTKSIKRLAKKYNGEINWNFDKDSNVFSINIAFPRKSER